MADIFACEKKRLLCETVEVSGTLGLIVFVFGLDDA